MKDGKGSRPDLAAGAETVTLTLDAGLARDLLQALTLALGPGRAAAGKQPFTDGGKGHGGGQPKR